MWIGVVGCLVVKISIPHLTSTSEEIKLNWCLYFGTKCVVN